MTYSKKIASLFLFAVLALTACTNPLAKKTAEPLVEKPDVQSIEVVEEVEELEVDDGVERYESRYGANMKCSMLKDGQERCEQDVNNLIGMMLEEEIMRRFDVNRCGELPGKVADLCKDRLTETGVVGPVSDEELAILSKIMLGTLPEMEEGGEENEEGGEAHMPTYDKARCAELTTSGYKEYCESEVVKRLEQVRLIEVIQSGSVEQCDEFTDEAILLDCKTAFDVEGEV